MRTGPLGLLLFLPAAALYAQEPENLFVDPSFEKAAVGEAMPAGWSTWQPDGGEYKAAVVEPGFTGARAVRLEGEGQYVHLNSADYAINPGDCYLFGARVRLEGGAGAQASLKLDLTGADHGWLRDMSTAYFLNGGGAWEGAIMFSNFAEAPKAAFFRVVVTLSGKGTLLVDDVYLAKIPEPDRTAAPLNGGMELRAQGVVVGWNLNRDAAAEAALREETADVHGGGSALRLAGKGTWASANSETTAVEAGAAYEARAWVKVGSGRAALRVSYWDEGRWLGSSDEPSVGPGDWVELKATPDLKKFERVTRLSLYVVAEGPAFDVLLDDASLVKKP